MSITENVKPARQMTFDEAHRSATLLCEQILGIAVLGKRGDTVRICHIESHHVAGPRPNRVIDIKNASRMTFDDLLVNIGPHVAMHVNDGRTQPEPKPGTAGRKFEVINVRAAIMFLASQNEITNETEFGRGLWRIKFDGKYLTILASGAKFDVYDEESKEFQTLHSPQLGPCVAAEQDSHMEFWYDRDRLRSNIELAQSKGWRESCFNEVKAYLRQFNWVNNEEDVKTIEFFIMMTFSQSSFKNPFKIFIQGPTCSGKSTFLNDFLKPLFGPICACYGNATAAGIRQRIGTSGIIFLHDEFDDHPAIRKNVRGVLDLIQKGDAGGSRRPNFKLRHILWFAGINIPSGIDRSKKGRWVVFHLEKPAAGTKPHSFDEAAIRELGERLLACAIVDPIKPVTPEFLLEWAKSVGIRQDPQTGKWIAPEHG